MTRTPRTPNPKAVLCCGRLRSGEACHRAPLPGEKFCRYHSAAGRIAAQLHGRKGGRPPTGGRTLKGSGEDLAETIARIQAEYPGFDLPQAVALCLREYREAATVALRLRALALLVTAVRGVADLEIARLRLKPDAPEFRGETLVIQVPMRPGHEDEYARDPEGNVIYAHPIGSQPPTPQGSP